MKKSKNQFIIMMVSFVFMIGLIGLFILMRDADHQTAETTSLLQATVTGVDVTDTGKAVSIEIFTEEYNSSLYISTNITENINKDEVKNLENGQTIFFRIENIKFQQMNKVAFVDITSLETDTKVVFSLEDYNQYMHDSLYPPRIAIIVVAAVFLSISLSSFIKIKRSKA